MLTRVLCTALILLLLTPVARAAERVALVIGNSAYTQVPRLDNPANDATDIAAALETTGFEVDLKMDLDFDSMRRALSAFGAKAARADVAVIYFAGHGIEVDRRNYLLPVDAALADPLDVDFQAMQLELMQRATEPARTLSLVIVDACRNNPFIDRMDTGTRSISRGLNQVEPRGKNRLVAFSAKPGTVAEDGDGRNSPYAAALKAALVEPGLEIGKLFRRVRDDVMIETNGRQEPAYYGSLTSEDFFFTAPEPEPAVASTSGDAAGMAEVAFWLAIADSSDPRDFADYLSRYPDGRYASLASRKLARALRESPEPEEVAMLPAPEPEPAAEEPATEPETSQEGGLFQTLFNPEIGTDGGFAPVTPEPDPAEPTTRPEPGPASGPIPEPIPSSAPAAAALEGFACLDDGRCIQSEPVPFDALMAYVNEAAPRTPSVLTAAEALRRGFDGAAEDVPLWLAKRYAAWKSAETGQTLCVANPAALSAGLRLSASDYIPAAYRELTGEVCRQYPNYMSSSVLEGDPLTSGTTRCVHEFAALPGQVFRLMSGAHCR